MRQRIWIVLCGVAFANGCHRGMYDGPVGIERRHDVVLAVDLATAGPLDAGPLETEGREREPQPGISRRPEPAPETYHEQPRLEGVSPTVGTHMEVAPKVGRKKPTKQHNSYGDAPNP